MSGFASARDALARLEALGSPEDAAFAQRYFKTGPGEYGEGDRFLGIRAPALRGLVRACDGLPLPELDALLHSGWNEARMLALLAMVRRYERADETERRALYRLYLARTDRVNNWNLVDGSAPGIAGAHLEGRSRRPLYRLARSPVLWERRIAVIATLRFIRTGDVADTLALADVLLHDRHDLIHKAVGWMLREAWYREDAAVRAFLAERCTVMPRTMLRYAIEKQPPAERRRWLAGEPPLSRFPRS